MAQLARNYYNSIFRFDYRPNRILNGVETNHGAEYQLALDVSDFGSPLGVSELLLDPPKATGEETAYTVGDLNELRALPTRPRIVLIPTPPPLPNTEMLTAVTISLNPLRANDRAPDIALPDSRR